MNNISSVIIKFFKQSIKTKETRKRLESMMELVDMIVLEIII